MQEHNQLSQKKLVEMSITAAALKSLAKHQQQRPNQAKIAPLLQLSPLRPTVYTVSVSLSH